MQRQELGRALRFAESGACARSVREREHPELGVDGDVVAQALLLQCGIELGDEIDDQSRNGRQFGAIYGGPTPLAIEIEVGDVSAPRRGLHVWIAQQADEVVGGIEWFRQCRRHDRITPESNATILIGSTLPLWHALAAGPRRLRCAGWAIHAAGIDLEPFHAFQHELARRVQVINRMCLIQQR